MVETQLPPPKEAMRSLYVLRLWEARDFSRVRLHEMNPNVLTKDNVEQISKTLQAGKQHIKQDNDNPFAVTNSDKEKWAQEDATKDITHKITEKLTTHTDPHDEP